MWVFILGRKDAEIQIQYVASGILENCEDTESPNGISSFPKDCKFEIFMAKPTKIGDYQLSPYHKSMNFQIIASRTPGMAQEPSIEIAQT
ncbi:hypothetical protein NL676_013003 [Syzygium grande]|nr:hypothetical protein NL676_013003 [Syzygium grande]